MILHLPGFAVSISILLLPPIHFFLQVRVVLLHFSHDLLILVYFYLVVLVVIDFAVELEFFLFQLREFPISILEQVIQFLQFGSEQFDLIFIVP